MRTWQHTHMKCLSKHTEHMTAHTHTHRADLHPGLRQPESLAQLLSHERVRIVCFVEQSLQLIQLLKGKVSPTPSLLDFSLCLILQRLTILFAFFHICVPWKQKWTLDPGMWSEGSICPLMSVTDVLSYTHSSLIIYTLYICMEFLSLHRMLMTGILSVCLRVKMKNLAKRVSVTKMKSIKTTINVACCQNNN